ncbi:MAG: hypothetical protein CVU05_10985 [Bacteroidetes bacterium HGW-Bacteroidetes-21]|jgi:heterodisulfide reductase subunit C|nr:MAG: hypothetical protein CVU05_10985 [Bacteroidetes bacterium HGW-Bacteroidetes-21]
MTDYFSQLSEDVRFQEGLNACINCGTCTAICPAAEVYDYDPRILTDMLQTRNNEMVEELLKSDMIWYCGECMSCKTRCPRNNVPGLLVIALRNLSQKTGFFTESEKGRQQLFLKRSIGEWILNYGYCVYAPHLHTSMFPELGDVWDWIDNHMDDVFTRVGAKLGKDGPGILRKIQSEDLDELKAIFDATGGTERYETIEKYSAKKAKEMGLNLDETHNNEYFLKIYNDNDKNHHEF